jgi:hypothetical protein
VIIEHDLPSSFYDEGFVTGKLVTTVVAFVGTVVAKKNAPRSCPLSYV